MRRLVLTLVALGAVACSDADTSAGAGGSGAVSSTSTTMPTTCNYPSPTSGVEVGEVLPETLKWMGFTPGAAAQSEIMVADLHDCDGTHGIHALLLSTLQPETSASGNHVAAIRDSLAEWSTQGIAVVFLLLNNPDGNEVTIEGTAAWRQSFMVNDTAYVVADADFLLVSGGQVSTPQNTVVDPRTMTVTAITEGHPFDATALQALAATNAP